MLSVLIVGLALAQSGGVCAHRGASVSCPENTIHAIREAVRRGAHAIELDVRASADGVLILMHDDRLDRTTNGTGLVSSKTLRELRRYDAGKWKNPRFRGERIPTLAEALAVIPQNIAIFLDVKEPALLEECKRVMRQQGGEWYASTDFATERRAMILSYTTNHEFRPGYRYTLTDDVTGMLIKFRKWSKDKAQFGR